MIFFKNVEMELADNPPPAFNCSLVVDLQLHVMGGLATGTKMGRA